MSERLKSLKEGDWIAFRRTENPKCPHCGFDLDISERDLYRLYEEGEHEVGCPSCDLDFTVSTRVSYSFSTDEQDEV